MRTLRRGITATLGLAMVVGVLSGCADEGTSPVETELDALETPVETAATAAPVLTDEEALQIAVETYEEYLALTGELIDSQGNSYEDLEAITTSNMTETNKESLTLAQQGQFTTEGQLPVVKGEVQRQTPQQIEARVCVDFSQSQTFDANGNPVGGDRDGVVRAFEIRVVSEDGVYKVDRSEQWQESSFCSE